MSVETKARPSPLGKRLNLSEVKNQPTKFLSARKVFEEVLFLYCMNTNSSFNLFV
ncbi:hypothetical protein GCM10007342_21440 [Staphylococcus pragensis]|nr:hypothetical protein GCM10007342_21440 [Staphylococcus pragensis]